MKTSKIQAKLIATILDLIYAQKAISRVDISKLTGITPATTTNITTELIAKGVIYEGGEDGLTAKVGRKKILLSISPNHSFYIGAEISERYFSFVLTDNLGTVIKKELYKMSTAHIKNKGITAFIQALRHFKRNCSKEITAIGISLPGRYIDDYKITTNNPLWQSFDLEGIEQAFTCPVFFSNNVNAMAIAKRLFSKEQGLDNFIYFHLYRGMHCSYMYNGKIYGRSNIRVGEIGHTIVSPDGELCECGKHGCLQTFASETWLIKKAQLLFTNAPSSLLKSLVTQADDLQLSHLLTAYDLGDSGTILLLHQAVQFIAQSILNLSSLIDAKKIFLHGPLLEHPVLAKRLHQHLQYQPLLLTTAVPDVCIDVYSQYSGARAGAALCIYKQLLSLD
ncbi:MarR family transcriptional regulator [Streptococcus iniae]|uniref:ROK family protein n=1 Tax=Streptococcus iniae TaxID=1346 RepID=UPI000EF72C4B|nr:ROK family protein [Streptococcus iniae]RLV28153.1 MarR family transcriptional regulator [Streptococcus iniae]